MRVIQDKTRKYTVPQRHVAIRCLQFGSALLNVILKDPKTKETTSPAENFLEAILTLILLRIQIARQPARFQFYTLQTLQILKSQNFLFLNFI